MLITLIWLMPGGNKLGGGVEGKFGLTMLKARQILIMLIMKISMLIKSALNRKT